MVLLSFLVVTGCSRRDILDDYPVSGVEAVSYTHLTLPTIA